MNGKNARFIVAATAVMSVVLSACGSDDDSSAAPDPDTASAEFADLDGGETLDELRDAGVVKIAIANNPPYTQLDTDGTVSGMIPDLVSAVMERLGVPEIEAVVAGYDAMINGLNAEQFDLVAAGLYMTDDRCAEVLFSQPDTVALEGFAVEKGNPKGITSFASVAADPTVKIALLAGGNTVEIAHDLGVPEDQIVELATQDDGFAEVQNGRVDAYGSPVVIITPEVQEQYGVEAVLISDVPPSGSGVAFRMSDEALRDAYDTAYDSVKEDGTYAELANEYGFDPELAPNTTRADISPACDQ